MSPIKATGKILVVEITNKENMKSEKGIYVCGAKPTHNEGIILDADRESVSSFKAGHKVLFGLHDGTSVNMDGKSYCLLHADKVLGIIEDNVSCPEKQDN